MRKAELQLQKLKTGGSRDEATLELNVARAQADVDTIRAALEGSTANQIRAQLGGARAELEEALFRLEQARAGKGGVDAGAEDIAMAEAGRDLGQGQPGLAVESAGRGHRPGSRRGGIGGGGIGGGARP